MFERLWFSSFAGFVRLKGKMFSLFNSDWEVNKTKGVNLKLKHKEYVDVLFGKNIVRHKMKRILSEKHSIGSYLLNKISLSCDDDKRFILDDGINSLAYGLLLSCRVFFIVELL